MIEKSMLATAFQIIGWLLLPISLLTVVMALSDGDYTGAGIGASGVTFGLVLLALALIAQKLNAIEQHLRPKE